MKRKPFIILWLVLLISIFFCLKGNCIQIGNVMETSKNTPADSAKIKVIEYKEGKGFLAFDADKNILFEVFPYDNGPDYPSEGLFRIIKNGKIGFADEMGNIIINPRMEAVFPFQNGMAAFCDGCSESLEGEHTTWTGGKWGFINRKGEKAVPAKYDKVINPFEKGMAKVEISGKIIYINKNGTPVNLESMKQNEWIGLLGATTKLMAKLFFEDTIDIALSWHNHEKYTFSANDHLDFLRITINTKEKEELMVYDVIPWQNFAIKPENDFLISMDEVSTVTDYAIIYSHYKPRERNKMDSQIIKKFNDIFSRVLEKDVNNQLLEEDRNIPDQIQFISKNNYRYYVDLQVAEPGTIMPADSVLMESFKGKMIYLQLIPDIASIRKRWIKGHDLPTDTYYTSVEDELIALFNETLTSAINSPDLRMDLFHASQQKMRSLFSAANSYVNFLYDKYEDRLSRWLFIEGIQAEIHNAALIFDDYNPKLTPDNALDYMPSIANEMKNIPNAKADQLPLLLALFLEYQEKAKTNPGQWEDGNIILGAQPKEYHPSSDELLLSEIGERISTILNDYPMKEWMDLLKEKVPVKTDLTYKRFNFTHADVMGSGRFFYVQSFEDTILRFKE